MGRKANGEEVWSGWPWTRHAARVCYSRFARSLRWFHAGGGGLDRQIGTRSLRAIQWIQIIL